MSHFNIEEGAQHILLGIGILTGLLALLQYAFRQRKRHHDALYTRRRQTEILLEINKELHPNDGTSVVDSIKRIEEGLVQHGEAIAELRIIITEISMIVNQHHIDSSILNPIKHNHAKLLRSILTKHHKC